MSAWSTTFHLLRPSTQDETPWCPSSQPGIMPRPRGCRVGAWSTSPASHRPSRSQGLGPVSQDLEIRVRRRIRGHPGGLHEYRSGDLDVAERAIQVTGGGVAIVEAGAETDGRLPPFSHAYLELEHQRPPDAAVPPFANDLEIVHHRQVSPFHAELRSSIVRPVDPDVTDGLVTLPRDEVGEDPLFLSHQSLLVLDRRPMGQRTRHDLELLTMEGADVDP